MAESIGLKDRCDEAESMAESTGTTLTHLLPSLVKPAQSLARPPISNFPVVAVGLGTSGRIFIGINLEFPGLPFHHTVHAEQFLVTNLSLNAEPLLHSFAVSAAPCGHCRQFLQELPHDFGPHDLLPKRVPLLLEPRHNNLSLIPHTHHDFSLPNEVNGNGYSTNSNSNLKVEPLEGASPYGINGYATNPDAMLKIESLEAATSNGVNGYVTNPNAELKVEALESGCGRNTRDMLKVAALEAAKKSHAPYSGSPSRVALLDCEGKIYKGSYLESAAYNPSLGPVQAALVAFVAGGGGYDQIVETVLVEKDGAVVKQEHTARLLLNSISPNCHFSAFLCTSGAD